MNRRNKMYLYIGAGLITVFILWTTAIYFIDVKPIGPDGSAVGFAALNGFIHSFTGVHMPLYVLTDWLGLIPFFIIFGFAVLGLYQWIKRKSIIKVDYDILVLGVYYIAVLALYIFFESFVINYRPILIDGILEASYPSSTTLLALCVMPTSSMIMARRIKSKKAKSVISAIICAFTAFMVIARLLSGVHWFSDIVGGTLLSTGLLIIYYSVTSKREH